MNERIKELVYQAEKISRQAVVDSKYKTSFNDIFNEKFAELIVKECIDIVDDAERGGTNEEWDNAAKFIRRDIKEHFGVE